jgi:hypothetical protein
MSGNGDVMDEESFFINGDDNDDNCLGEGEEDRTINLFLETIARVEELEKMKAALDDRESKLRANLRVKYDEEKSTTKVASDLLFEKESLRDELIRLKDGREKLIDELQVLKSVDEEMSAFNNLNEQFNESLRKHLASIEEKQARIYTLKPIITGTHVACEADFSGDDKIDLHKHLQEVLRANIKNINVEIKKICEINFIKTNDEWRELNDLEKKTKNNIRLLKNKIKERQRAKAGGSKKDDDESETSFSSKKRGSKRVSDEDFTCEACAATFPDQERFAYHCFRGCSQLEDLLRYRGQDVTMDCAECGDKITSFMSFHDHLKTKHGYGSPEEKKDTSSSQKNKKRR